MQTSVTNAFIGLVELAGENSATAHLGNRLIGICERGVLSVFLQGAAVRSLSRGEVSATDFGVRVFQMAAKEIRPGYSIQIHPAFPHC